MRRFIELLGALFPQPDRSHNWLPDDGMPREPVLVLHTDRRSGQRELTANLYCALDAPKTGAGARTEMVDAEFTNRDLPADIQTDLYEASGSSDGRTHIGEMLVLTSATMHVLQHRFDDFFDVDVQMSRERWDAKVNEVWETILQDVREELEDSYRVQRWRDPNLNKEWRRVAKLVLRNFSAPYALPRSHKEAMFQAARTTWQWKSLARPVSRGGAAQLA